MRRIITVLMKAIINVKKLLFFSDRYPVRYAIVAMAVLVKASYGNDKGKVVCTVVRFGIGPRISQNRGRRSNVVLVLLFTYCVAG